MCRILPLGFGTFGTLDILRNCSLIWLKSIKQAKPPLYSHPFIVKFSSICWNQRRQHCGEVREQTRYQKRNPKIVPYETNHRKKHKANEPGNSTGCVLIKMLMYSWRNLIHAGPSSIQNTNQPHKSRWMQFHCRLSLSRRKFAVGTLPKCRNRAWVVKIVKIHRGKMFSRSVGAALIHMMRVDD